MPEEGTRGTYLLQPINTTRERGKRKRKLVIDSCKVLTNKLIRTQLSDCADTTYQMRTFPPVSRRAIQCKARCADETLLTMPAVVSINSAAIRICCIGMRIRDLYWIVHWFKGQKVLLRFLDASLYYPGVPNGPMEFALGSSIYSFPSRMTILEMS